MKLNRRLVRLMLASRDMSVRDLARASGVHEQTLYNLMAGKDFTSGTLAKIAAALDCHPVDLIDAQGYPDPNNPNVARFAELV